MSICQNVLYAKEFQPEDYYSDVIWVIDRFKYQLVSHRYMKSSANALMLSYLCFAREVGEEILRRLTEDGGFDSAIRMVGAASGFALLDLYMEVHALANGVNKNDKQGFLESVLRKAVKYSIKHFEVLSSYADQIRDFNLEKCLSRHDLLKKLRDPWSRYDHFSHLTLTPMICILHDSMEGFIDFIPVATLEEAKAAAKADRMKKVRYACIGYRKDDGKAEFLYISERPEQVIPPSISGATSITWDGSREYNLYRPVA